MNTSDNLRGPAIPAAGKALPTNPNIGGSPEMRAAQAAIANEQPEPVPGQNRVDPLTDFAVSLGASPSPTAGKVSYKRKAYNPDAELPLLVGSPRDYQGQPRAASFRAGKWWPMSAAGSLQPRQFARDQMGMFAAQNSFTQTAATHNPSNAGATHAFSPVSQDPHSPLPFGGNSTTTDTGGVGSQLRPQQPGPPPQPNMQVVGADAPKSGGGSPVGMGAPTIPHFAANDYSGTKAAWGGAYQGRTLKEALQPQMGFHEAEPAVGPRTDHFNSGSASGFGGPQPTLSSPEPSQPQPLSAQMHLVDPAQPTGPAASQARLLSPGELL